MVTRQLDIKKIIDIKKFTPLNTVKQLDFLAFSPGQLLNYTFIKSSMNKILIKNGL